MVRGVEGIVTDGGFRDSAEIADLQFSSYHNRPSAPTNLTLHQAIAINDPIGCGDVAVFPGDMIIGDDDGVMVIPAHIAEDVANECLQMTLYEEFVIEKVQNGKPIIGLYPMVNDEIKKEFEAWKLTQK
jgi:regulator of RNase E activity RraA